jgi:hypothetical protein
MDGCRMAPRKRRWGFKLLETGLVGKNSLHAEYKQQCLQFVTDFKIESTSLQ